MQSNLIEVIEEQGKVIELQSERIRKLSELAANYMTVEEMEKIKAKEVKVKLKDISKSVKTPNKNMKTMTFYERNKTYLNKVMNKDIMNVFLALNNKSIPLYIRDIKVEE